MIGLYGIAFWLPTIVKAFGVRAIRGRPDHGHPVLRRRRRHAAHQPPFRPHGRAPTTTSLNVSAGAIGLIFGGVYASNPSSRSSSSRSGRSASSDRCRSSGRSPRRSSRAPRRPRASASSTRSATWADMSGRTSRSRGEGLFRRPLGRDVCDGDPAVDRRGRHAFVHSEQPQGRRPVAGVGAGESGGIGRPLSPSARRSRPLEMCGRGRLDRSDTFYADVFLRHGYPIARRRSARRPFVQPWRTLW